MAAVGLLPQCALLVGALTIILGFYQSSLMVGPLHWIIEMTHLILGILTIGLGHMGVARYRRGRLIANNCELGRGARTSRTSRG